MEIGLLQAALPSLFRTLQVGALVASLGVLWSGVPSLSSFGSVEPAAGPQGAPPLLAAAPHELTEYSVIGTRNLFRSQEKASAPVAEPVIEKSQMQLRLVGTMASTSPELSVAVVEERGGAAELKVVSIGDSVGNGQATVVRIEPRRVVVEREGRLEALEIDPEDAAGGPPAPPSGAELLRTRAAQRLQQGRAAAAAARAGRRPLPGRPTRQPRDD